MFLQTYWLPGIARKNSTTGREVIESRGPFCVMALGCAINPLTEQEVIEHVRKLHGVEPVKVETMENAE